MKLIVVTAHSFLPCSAPLKQRIGSALEGISPGSDQVRSTKASGGAEAGLEQEQTSPMPPLVYFDPEASDLICPGPLLFNNNI